MGNERKCQAGCGHPRESHVTTLSGVAHCTLCCGPTTRKQCLHPFDTLESLRAEVEAAKETVAKWQAIVVDTYVSAEAAWDLRKASYGQWGLNGSVVQRAFDDGYVAASKALESADLREKLKTANARASELFDELGIVQNEAQTQRGELVRQVAQLTAERDLWRFVPDERGGHVLSVPTGDKWYPESFVEQQVAALTAERDEAWAANAAMHAEADDFSRSASKVAFEQGRELTALRRIALTDEALIDVAGILTIEARYTSSLSEAGGMKHVADRIRAARGVKA